MLPRRRFLYDLSAGLLASPFFWPCNSRAASIPPIRVGVTGAFTSSGADQVLLAENMRNGVRLATSELNLTGGVNGQLIELVERDDQGQAMRAMKIAEEWGRTDKVVAVIAAGNAQSNQDWLNLYQQARLPVILTGASELELTLNTTNWIAQTNFVFRIAPTLNQELSLFKRVIRQRGWQQVGLFAPFSANWDSSVADLEMFLRGQTGDLAYRMRYRPGEMEFRDHLLDARKSGLQALVAWGGYAELLALLQTRNQMGWRIPVMTHWSLASPSLVQQTNPLGDGLFVPQAFIAEYARASRSFRNSFFMAYEERFKSGRIEAPMAATQGYDALNLMAAAMGQAPNLQGMAIKRTLENLSGTVAGAMLSYQQPFSATQHDAMTEDRLLLAEVKEGRLVSSLASARRNASESGVVSGRSTWMEPNVNNVEAPLIDWR